MHNDTQLTNAASESLAPDAATEPRKPKTRLILTRLVLKTHVRVGGGSAQSSTPITILVGD